MGDARTGGRFSSVGVPAEKSKDFKAASSKLIDRLRPERARVLLVLVMAIASVTMVVFGPKILGHATDIIFEGLTGRNGRDGIDFDELHRVLLLGTRAVRVVVRAVVPAGVRARRCGAAHDAPPALRRRGQAEPPAPGLGRPATARRPAQPGHQRHRQRGPEPAADPQPTAHLGAHHRRGAGDDVRHLAGAGAGGRGHRAGLDPGDAGDRRPLEAEVHGPVAAHGLVERTRRRDVHRSCRGEGVRPPARGRGPLPRHQRRALPRPASAPSSSRVRSSR